MPLPVITNTPNHIPADAEQACSTRLVHPNCSPTSNCLHSKGFGRMSSCFANFRLACSYFANYDALEGRIRKCKPRW